MARTVLLQSRHVASATASGLPITISAGTQQTVQVGVSELLTNVQQNEVIKVKILDSVIAANSNLIVILQANIVSLADTTPQTVGLHTPAFAGTYNGALNGAAFESEVTFHSEDFGQFQNQSFYLYVLASNTDSASHNVTSFGVTFELTRTQWSEPSYGSPLE